MSFCLGPTLNAVERNGDRQTLPDGLGRMHSLWDERPQETQGNGGATWIGRKL